MRRAIGVVMVLTGLLPLMVVGVGLWVWAQHTYTVGLSATIIRGLTVVAFADVLLIGGGAYLLSRPKNSMAKLGDSVSGALRTFGFWLANGTVGYPLLEGIDYSCIFHEPSALQAAMAIYANVLRMDESGRVLNAKAAEGRAAQFIRSYVDPTYVVDPPLEDWEVALHEPPGRADIDPDAALKSN